MDFEVGIPAHSHRRKTSHMSLLAMEFMEIHKTNSIARFYRNQRKDHFKVYFAHQHPPTSHKPALFVYHEHVTLDGEHFFKSAAQIPESLDLFTKVDGDSC